LVYSRNTEVAAFLTELLEMKVRCVIANGFTCAHNDCNPKTLMEMQAPHFDPMRVLPAGYLRGRTTHSSYKLGCGRDFFNFFGSPNGDDGLPWKATSEPRFRVSKTTAAARRPPLHVLPVPRVGSASLFTRRVAVIISYAVPDSDHHLKSAPSPVCFGRCR